MLDIIGARAPMRILELFCRNPEANFYSKEIGQKLGLSKATTIKWLKRLTREGLLAKTPSGRKKFYKLQWEHPFSRQVRVLFTLAELALVIRGLRDLRGAYLVGAAARGSDAPDSPIELLVMTRADKKYIREALERVSRKLGRPIESRVMTPLEYAELSKKDRNLHERLEREKIRLIGAEGER
jgi:predicted nucleotidyltransferase